MIKISKKHLFLSTLLLGLAFFPPALFAYQGGIIKPHNHTSAAGDGGLLTNLTLGGVTTLGVAPSTATIDASGNITAPKLTVNGVTTLGVAPSTATIDASGNVTISKTLNWTENVVMSSYTATTTTTNTNYSQSVAAVTITPHSVNSRIMLTFNSSAYVASGGTDTCFYSFAKNAAEMTGSSGFQTIENTSATPVVPVSFSHIDSPATTSAITYTVVIKTTNAHTMADNPNNSVSEFSAREIFAGK